MREKPDDYILSGNWEEGGALDMKAFLTDVMKKLTSMEAILKGHYHCDGQGFDTSEAEWQWKRGDPTKQ